MDTLQIIAIADQINKKVNIPIIGEKVEAYFFTGAVALVDAALIKEASFNVNDYIENPEKTITEDEWTAIVQKATSSLNKLIDIPLMYEVQEQFLIGLILDTIKQFAVSKISLNA